MHSDTAEDENFNTSCTGKVIHTLMTPGLITRTYMPLTHWQIFTLQTLLWLDDLQYKETTEILQTILIPTSLWLFNTSQQLLQFTAPFVSTIQTCFLPFIHHTTVQPFQLCLACLPPSSSLLAPLPLVLVAPLMSLPLPLLTAQPVMNWSYPTSK